MNELILKFNGEITENTFPRYKNDALAFVKKASFPIVSNNDFSTAISDVKKCKAIEAAILEAKENAFSEMKEISETLDDLNQVYDTVRDFRLKRDKSITEAKEDRKEKVISDGYKLLTATYKERLEECPSLPKVVELNDKALRLAIKGRRSEEAGKKAVAEAVENEKERFKQTAISVNENINMIKSSGYEDLFHDSDAIIGKPAFEVKLVVENRISKHKLAEKERKEREEAAAAAAEKARKEKEEARQVERDKNPSVGQVLTQTQDNSSQEGKAAAGVEAIPGEPEQSFLLEIELKGAKTAVKQIARGIKLGLESKPEYVGIKLNLIEQ